MDPDVLSSRARRAYELGRLRMAAQVAVLLLPIALLCVTNTTSREECACLATLLLALVIGLRWRDRRGVDAATTGLLAGIIPLVAGLLLTRWGPGFASSLLYVACGVAGLAGGFVLGVRAARRRAGASAWFFSAAVALVAAALGCVGLGPAFIGVVAGVVGGGSVGALQAKWMNSDA